MGFYLKHGTRRYSVYSTTTSSTHRHNLFYRSGRVFHSFYLQFHSLSLQLFHLLKHNGTGGKSLFVDGFHAANHLKSKNPLAYNILSTLKISTLCAGDESVTMNQSTFPILNHNEHGLYQIRFNNDDRSLLSNHSL